MSEVRKIIHLADIHCRLFKRHGEYKKVFEQLYADLKARDLRHAVIVVAGDIVHSKIELSPEMITLVSDFFRSLATLAPTIVIAGNHDCNLANQDRLDALTPIVQNLNDPNIHYYRESGVYSFADVDFYVHSIIGEQADWPKPIQNGRKKIALFHGPIHNAKTDVGYTVTNRHVMIEHFDGYDMVLCGDIHRHQVLQEFNASEQKPIIVYCSSLVQQNHGETLKGHGYCEWDVPTCSFKFHEVKNPYGYYTLNIEDGKVPDYSDMPENVRLRIFAGNMDQSDIKKLVSMIRTKRNVTELSVSNTDGMKRGTNTQALGTILDINDIQFQNKLIVDFARRKMPELTDETLENVLKLNKAINDAVNSDDLARKLVWRPLSLKFDNLFTYGEGNSIDFTTLTGVTGIFAPNASGKTSIAEAICFALYDKTPRTIKAANIMNTRKNSCFLEFRFEVDGIEYTVERKGKRSPKGEVKIDVNFWKTEKGIRTNLNGEERRYTDKNIAKVVGEYEDFILTTFSSSSQAGLFVDRGQSDRKDLLSQFLGLNIFDRLHTLASDESKDLLAALKRFKTDDFTQELVDVDGKIGALTDEIVKLESQDTWYNERLAEVETEIQEFYATKVPLTTKNLDLAQLESSRGFIESEIHIKKDSLMEINGSLTKTNDILSRANAKIKSEYATFDNDYQKFQLRRAAVAEFHMQHEARDKEIKKLTHNLQQLQKFQYDPNCQYCLENGKATIGNIAQVEAELARLLPMHDVHTVQLAAQEAEMLELVPMWEDRSKKYKAGQEFIKTKEREILTLTQQQGALMTEIATLEHRLATVLTDIELYQANANAIFTNNLIDSQIAAAEGQKRIFKTQAAIGQQAIKHKHGDCVVLQQKKQDMLFRITEAKNLEAKCEVYNVYLATVCRDGLPYTLIADILPTLETSVNNLLSQMVDFTVGFETDGKNVNMKIVYDTDRIWPLELASGMEKFITGLAIRVALSGISSLPKSNFLILDEGLGALDADNLSSIFMLFDVLRTQFDFLFLISHVDVTRDVADTLVEIHRRDGFSKIQIP